MKRTWLFLGLLNATLLFGCGQSLIEKADSKTAIAPFPQAVTRSTGTQLDATTLEKFRNYKAILHRFSDGRVLSVFNDHGEAVDVGGHIIIAKYAELPEKIVEYEKKLQNEKIESRNLQTQGIGIKPNTCGTVLFSWGACLFQGGVPYVIDSSITGTSYNKVLEAVGVWNSSSAAIKFRPRVTTREPWVNFRISDTCSSYVGLYQSQQSGFWLGQNINLNSCIGSIGSILHEMGHASALWHEQQRCDRDNYVVVNSSDDTNNGKRCENNVSMYGKYDFDSVMHYGISSSINLKPNLPYPSSSYDGNPYAVGQRQNLSAGDQNAVNGSYQTLSSPFAVGAQAHGVDYGWQNWAQSSNVAGTIGQGRRIEAFRISVKGLKVGLGISYAAHVVDLGWLPSVNDSGIAGTTGQGRRIEAFYAYLTGSRSGCTLSYKAHVSGIGWMNTVVENGIAGTTGQGRQLEAMQVFVNCL